MPLWLGFDVGEFHTLGEAIRHHAEHGAARPAIVATESFCLTYGELFENIRTVRAELHQSGFDRHARIVVAVENGPLTALAVVTIACSAVAVPIDLKKLTLLGLDDQLAALRPAAVVLLSQTDSPARTIAERQGIPLIQLNSHKGKLNLHLFGHRPSSAQSPKEPIADSPAFILHTSSTTGKPKVIPTSHRSMLAAAARVRAWFELTPLDRCLCVSPVHYAHGLHVTVFAPLLSGGTIAFPTDASKFDYLEWFGNLKPTWYSAGPTLHHLIFDQIKSKAHPTEDHRLRFVLSGGAPLKREVQQGLQEALGVPVVEHYGSSEAMQICSNLLPPGPCKLGTVGIPSPNTVRIIGDDSRQLPTGERGEIWIGGPTVFSGYLDAPELNRVSLIDGWFRTGDIGSLDEDGFLTLHGRKDDLINRGGEKIAPSEIDNALMRHPAVMEAAAYAVHHPRLGEDVAAVVVLQPGSAVTKDDLRKFLSTQLPWFKVPRRIDFRDQLPKGPTGKLQRRKVGDG
jgi:acyl-CoA synthetase (AMP-forming)/AMP-acid ligase II